MRGVLVAAVLLFALACGRGEAPPAARFEGGGLQVEVSPDPGGPRTGPNRFRVTVHDAEGRPADDAEVALHARMDMTGMASMRAGGPARPMGGGAYELEVPLDMAGTWQLSVEARRAGGGAVQARGSLTTGVPGLRLEAAGAEPGPAPGGGPEAAQHEHDHAAAPAAAPRDADVVIDEARRRQIGIATAPAVRAPFAHVVRATGRVVAPEAGLVDVSLKVRGWVQELRANALGVPVARGDVLFTVYSPELYAAQEEYLQAARSRRAARESSAVDRADALTAAARTRLRLWDVSDADVAALERRGRAFEAVPIRSPASGFVIEKNVVQGAAVEPGARLLRIAPSDRVWIEAQIDEGEQGLVAVGQPARVSFFGDAAGAREASVRFVEPTLDPATRTARIRLELANPAGALRPGAFADVELRIERGERLVVPVTAVLYTGPRRLVFVDAGGGRLRPTEVQLGLANDEQVEVLSGLEAGQRVVVAGNFLVAAESRLRAALESW